MEDQDIPRMLRSCYIYALYEELCYNRGEQEGKVIFSKILQVVWDNLFNLKFMNKYVLGA